MSITDMQVSQKHFQRAHRAELILGGKGFFNALIKIIDEAQWEIHMQVYILDNDQTGNAILQALYRAVDRNVHVYLVLDRYGSSKLSKSKIEEIKTSGIRFKWFRPVIRFGNMEFGRRMHHKILSVDESVAIATGVNYADRYNDVGSIQAWLDFALIIEGPPAIEVKRRCVQIWESRLNIGRKYRPFRLPEIEGGLKAEDTMVKVSVNDFLRNKREIYRGYVNAFDAAQKEILIVGGYFLPGRITRQKLKEASKRGVKIRVMLTGVSDVAFAKESSEFLYQWMFKNNIEIYEWQPTVLHGKLAVVDQIWSTVGSFNINYLSTFESLELNFELLDAPFAEQLSNMLEQILANECVQITEESYLKKHSLRKRIKNRFSYWFVRNSFRLLNAFSNKPKPN